MQARPPLTDASTQAILILPEGQSALSSPGPSSEIGGNGFLAGRSRRTCSTRWRSARHALSTA